MGGAFVAVADDATATWWNPAGLAGGSYFSASSRYDQQPDPTDRGRPRAVSACRGISRLGLSYYRLPISEMRPAPLQRQAPASRQDQQAECALCTVLTQFGATVGQSLGNHLVVGSTLKSDTRRRGDAQGGSLDRAA